MIHRRAAVALLALAACGKESKEPAPAEPKAAEATTPSGTPPAAAPKNDKPTAAPVKAAARGPEHAVYSLADNRLSAHLTRGNGLVVAAGSAGFAKYTRIGNVMKGAKKAWELRQSEGEIKV